MATPSPSLCRWCRNELIGKAVVCAKCGRHQSRALVRLDVFSSVISFLMLVIAIVQLQAARAEREEAAAALRAAHESQAQALDNNVFIWETILSDQKFRMDELPKEQAYRLKSFGARRDRIQQFLLDARKKRDDFRVIRNLSPKD